MKTLRPLFILLLLIGVRTPASFAQNCWDEVWRDDFNGTALNTADWIYDTGKGFDGGWGNNELEYYTNTTSNVDVSGGYLNIIARYQNNYASSGKNFTSGRILTRDKHKWTYGRFEASMKLPAGTGTWPAFWMLPQNSSYGGWPTGGEIDIMEFRGDLPSKVDGTLHYGNSFPNNLHDGNPYSLSSGNFTNAFHLFAVEWEPNEIRWYVDGVLFKTEKKSPNTLNPASNNAVDWPWDQDFYVLFNLAIGGWYSGNPSESSITGGNTSWTATLQVDYVKIYTDLSGGELSGNITGKTSTLPNETNLTYSIPTTTGATYAWTTSSGTIISGQNTNSIMVNWGSGSGEVKVVKTIGCGHADYTLPVTILPASCGTMLCDFESANFNTYGYIHGQFTPKVINPASSVENTSPFCAQYTRNPSEQYDVLIVENPGLGDADLIENNSKRFMMDVYSNAAGRNIDITLENSNTSSGAYPTGRHSTYRATTTKVNQWETLTFVLTASPEPGLVGTSVNRLVFLFSPNTYTNPTFYFDNLLLNETPAAGAMTGVSSFTTNQQNLTYSIPNKAGVSYTWTVPSDATINSGQNTNSIDVSFGTLGGTISVTPTIGACPGTPVTKVVTNSSITGISNASFQSLNLFPNPASDFITLELSSRTSSGLVKIQILENTGRIISESEYKNTSGDALTFSIADLKPGHYLVKISDGEYSGVKTLFKK